MGWVVAGFLSGLGKKLHLPHQSKRETWTWGRSFLQGWWVCVWEGGCGSFFSYRQYFLVMKSLIRTQTIHQSGPPEFGSFPREWREMGLSWPPTHGAEFFCRDCFIAQTWGWHPGALQSRWLEWFIPVTPWNPIWSIFVLFVHLNRWDKYNPLSLHEIQTSPMERHRDLWSHRRAQLGKNL